MRCTHAKSWAGFIYTRSYSTAWDCVSALTNVSAESKWERERARAEWSDAAKENEWQKTLCTGCVRFLSARTCKLKSAAAHLQCFLSTMHAKKHRQSSIRDFSPTKCFGVFFKYSFSLFVLLSRIFVRSFVCAVPARLGGFWIYIYICFFLSNSIEFIRNLHQNWIYYIESDKQSVIWLGFGKPRQKITNTHMYKCGNVNNKWLLLCMADDARQQQLIQLLCLP